MITNRVLVENRLGLHAKPASMFVQKANQFQSEVYIRKDQTRVNAKSIMGVMILSVQKGDEIDIEATGDDEENAVNELTALIEGKFGED